MRYHQYEKVEKLFQRCLIKVLNIDLWKCYLNYVKETKGSLPSYREKMAQAYDFALDKMGMDVHAHQIWVDYIEFLKSVEAVGTYAENQRITGDMISSIANIINVKSIIRFWPSIQRIKLLALVVSSGEFLGSKGSLKTNDFCNVIALFHSCEKSLPTRLLEPHGRRRIFVEGLLRLRERRQSSDSEKNDR